MRRFVKRTGPRLSYLVGPGPDAGGASCAVRLGVINRDEQLQVMRLRLSLRTIEGSSIAELHWSQLVGRRRSRGFDIALDWADATLSVEREAHVAISAALIPGAGHVLRAELLTDDDLVYDVLEVGVRSSDSARAVANIGVPR